MSVDWPNFTPVASTIGGTLIGIAASFMILFIGRIAGISGIVGGLLKRLSTEQAWRIAFIAGLMFAPWLYGFGAALPPLQIDAGTVRLMVAGVLVGLGTRYAGGCTSGHGVAGLSRGSLRSLVATASFMFAGFVTVFIARHVLGA